MTLWSYAIWCVENDGVEKFRKILNQLLGAHDNVRMCAHSETIFSYNFIICCVVINRLE